MSSDSAIERLRALLNERGVEWWNDTDPEPQRQTNVWAGGQLVMFHENANGTVGYVVHNTHDLTPEQAIAATLGNDGVSERIKSFYLVMVADDLLEDGTPLCAYLDVPSAERRASRERSVDEDGVRHYAWVTEVKVVGE